MFRIFIYLCPVLQNFLLFAVFYNTAIAFTRAGYGALHLTLIPAIWAVFYAVIAPVCGKVATDRNAAKLIAGAALAEAVLMGFFAYTECVLWKQYLLVVLLGAATSVYCTPFQVFMRAAERGSEGGAVRATALYTFAWSFGSGLGPFFMSRLSMRGGYLTAGAIALVLAVGVLLLGAWYKRIASQPLPAPAEKPRPVTDYSKYPDLAKMGWIGAAVGVLIVNAVRMLLPYQVEKLGFDKVVSGNAVALYSFAQGFLALALIKGRTWMFRPLPIAGALVSGLAGMTLFAVSASPLTFYLGALLFGCYCGIFYFQLVFYSVVHPTKSTKYIAMNEFTVGLATAASGLTGLLVGGGSPALLFLLCGGAAGTMMLAEVITLGRLSRKDRNSISQ